MSQNNSFINISANSSNNLDISSASKNSPNIIGTLKTTLGDINISIENSSETPTNINTYVNTFLDSAFQRDNFNFFPNSRNITFISPELIEIEVEIGDLLNDLQKLDSSVNSSSSTSNSLSSNLNETPNLKTPFPFLSSLNAPSKNLYKKSLSTYEMINTNEKKIETPSSEKNKSNQKTNYFEKRQSHLKKDDTININIENNFLNKEEKNTSSSKQEKDHQNQKEKEQQQHHHQNQKEKEEEQKKISKCKEISINSISIEELRYHDSLKQLKKSKETSSPCLRKKLDSPIEVFNASYSNKKKQETSNQKVHVENVFIKFMQLMAKILGQAEAEAHELYLKIKERTDNIDLLTLLLSKVNSEKEDINWENNDEMKFLINKARSCGVDIPQEKYSWSEEEKKLLKENIQMRKDSMEKITQLERTDMQRYLQEVSQCHQTRSNVLKLLKEVIDTFIYNLRP